MKVRNGPFFAAGGSETVVRLTYKVARSLMTCNFQQRANCGRIVTSKVHQQFFGSRRRFGLTVKLLFEANSHFKI